MRTISFKRPYRAEKAANESAFNIPKSSSDRSDVGFTNPSRLKKLRMVRVEVQKVPVHFVRVLLQPLQHGFKGHIYNYPGSDPENQNRVQQRQSQ
jgi:hypothetical protein